MWRLLVTTAALLDISQSNGCNYGVESYILFEQGKYSEGYCNVFSLWTNGSFAFECEPGTNSGAFYYYTTLNCTGSYTKRNATITNCNNKYNNTTNCIVTKWSGELHEGTGTCSLNNPTEYFDFYLINTEDNEKYGIDGCVGEQGYEYELSQEKGYKFIVLNR